MNKRIKELMEKSSVQVLGHGAFGEVERYQELDLEKFAELIIKECASVCGNPQNLNYKPSQRILEHFGIE